MNELAPTQRQIKEVLQAINRRARSDPNVSVTLDEVAAVTSLAKETAKIAGIMLEHRGFVRCELKKIDQISSDGTFLITPKGVEEAARLQLPFWKRWARDPAVKIALISILASLITSGTTFVLGKIFTK
jgi:hypothetical protein